MKKCCKNVNILADDFIEDSIYEALDEKWKRSVCGKDICMVAQAQ